MNTAQIAKGVVTAAMLCGVVAIGGIDLSAEQGKGRSAPLPPSLASRAERCAVDPTPAAQLEDIDLFTRATKDSGGILTVPAYWHLGPTAGAAGNTSALIPARI